MMKRMTLYMTLLVASLFLGGWAGQSVPAATQTDEAALAVRSVVTGYLSGLQTGYLDSDHLASLYLTPDAAQSDIVATLANQTIDRFTLDDLVEVATDRYQATVILEPANQTLLLAVDRAGNRWQITSLVWGARPASTPEAGTSPAQTAQVSSVVSQATAPAIQGTLLIQPETGGPFYLVTGGGTGLRYLSSGIDPALSPDGMLVAFTRWTSGNDGSVWLYNLADGKEWQLLGETQQAKSPTWSADGSQLVVAYQHAGRRYMEQICTHHHGRLPAGAYDIKINRAEGKICYKLPPDPHWQLRRIDVATGAFEDLPSATYTQAPTWDPANPWRIVFASSTGLLQLDLNRGEYFPFGSGSNRFYRGPVFSPDGSKVAYTFKQDSHWEVYAINVADASVTRLTQSPLFVTPVVSSAAPAWSPDGSQIVYVSDKNGTWEFWVMNADGTNQHLLLSPEVAATLQVTYHGVDERLISWVN